MTVSKSAPQPAVAHYLIGYEPSDPRAAELEDCLIDMGAQRVSRCEWVLKTEPGNTLELYRSLGRRFDVRGFFAQQLDGAHDWDSIVVEADVFFALLKSS
jgi:hypothetical protein